MSKKYTVVVLVLAALLSAFGPADGFRERFRAAVQANKPAAVEQTLKDWEKAAPRDPDLYVAQFNWLLKKAERVLVQPGPAKGKGIEFEDKKGQTVGNLSSGYDPELVKQAAAALGKGLGFAPDRLDMHFGLAKLYEMTGQPAPQLLALRTALAAHPANGQPWRWRDGGALPGPEAQFVPATLEEYASYYWRQDRDHALEDGRAIADLIEKYYPKSSLGPFNVGMYYAFKKQPAQAYAKLQQADALAPNDPSTVGNLARLAIELKRKDEAARYLAQMRKMPGYEADANELTKELKQL
ncbi:tetratricopeptide repeat protein [Hymenobacter ruricola]|uniref:Tetratricopeptide repeat protein n=1 Tax=Hymenobacter ruricola TaxID=2791023 RepID=A0ABS0I5T3_9BACT|nr:tetratricopeptide repeat protein [Hymenobacter ruricola]MBF9222262.1 tetratricopeptide repeat protein [Hymenobacter ruricola]